MSKLQRIRQRHCILSLTHQLAANTYLVSKITAITHSIISNSSTEMKIGMARISLASLLLEYFDIYYPPKDRNQITFNSSHSPIRC